MSIENSRTAYSRGFAQSVTMAIIQSDVNTRCDSARPNIHVHHAASLKPLPRVFRQRVRMNIELVRAQVTNRESAECDAQSPERLICMGLLLHNPSAAFLQGANVR